jgi:hypothetical protein
MTGFRRLYGSHPLHLLGHLAMFFVAGWAINQILGGGNAINWLAWFVGAALLHDLVLLPVYSLVDRGLERGTHASPNRRVAALDPVPDRDADPAPETSRSMINYIRVPAAIAGILLLVYFPVILGYSSANYRNDTGHALTGSTRNWLLVSAGLFICSGLVYVVRVMRRGSAPPTPGPGAQPGTSPTGEHAPG